MLGVIEQPREDIVRDLLGVVTSLLDQVEPGQFEPLQLPVRERWVQDHIRVEIECLFEASRHGGEGDDTRLQPFRGGEVAPASSRSSSSCRVLRDSVPSSSRLTIIEPTPSFPRGADVAPDLTTSFSVTRGISCRSTMRTSNPLDSLRVFIAGGRGNGESGAVRLQRAVEDILASGAAEIDVVIERERSSSLSYCLTCRSPRKTSSSMAAARPRYCRATRTTSVRCDREELDQFRAVCQGIPDRGREVVENSSLCSKRWANPVRRGGDCPLEGCYRPTFTATSGALWSS